MLAKTVHVVHLRTSIKFLENAHGILITVFTVSFSGLIGKVIVQLIRLLQLGVVAVVAIERTQNSDTQAIYERYFPRQINICRIVHTPITAVTVFVGIDQSCRILTFRSNIRIVVSRTNGIRTYSTVVHQQGLECPHKVFSGALCLIPTSGNFYIHGQSLGQFGCQIGTEGETFVILNATLQQTIIPIVAGTNEILHFVTATAYRKGMTGSKSQLIHIQVNPIPVAITVHSILIFIQNVL